MKKFKIEIVKNGPYKISKAVPLINETILSKSDAPDESIAWHKVKSYKVPEDEEYYLCRCGQSKNTPFCDGSHETNNFNGTELASKEIYEKRAVVDEGETVDLLDDKKICAGLRFCRAYGGIRNLVHNSSDEELREKAKDETIKCSAGRITLRDKETGELIEEEFEPEISTVEDPYRNYYGPLWVKGDIELYGSDGEKYEDRQRVTLCRCGESKNKPFCDSAHYECKHMKLD